ncbi:FkbM family methyltransferase [Inquilinus sp. CA228]|uniref:FkbM family methyltransferase n=1 Tax=Inquilinus sp. CA228 TaxID=3455609 RepID=UPI003F8D5112
MTQQAAAMKQVGGWWLPAAERHLVPFLQRDRGYQAKHRAAALKHVQRWRVAVDIGAHVGLWAKDLAERFREVWAFEPIEAHRDCFRRNVTAENVVLKPVALGEACGRVAMNWDGANTGHTRVDEGTAGDVVLVMLDDYELKACDFIKVDAEGYEAKILRGARETILRHRPIINVEQKRWVYPGEHQYSAVEYLVSLGMVQLDRVSDDIVMGWPA